MALNYLWLASFLAAFVIVCIKLVAGDAEVARLLINGIFESSRSAVMDIALPLIGVMSFWVGILNIGEKAGFVQWLARVVRPFFSCLFPKIPPDHPANAQMMMNVSANLLGLDNVATPFGLKAMASLQDCNPRKETASDAQIMFVALHASGLTLFPLSVVAQRAVLGASNPTDIFIPCVIATYSATLVSILVVVFKQNLLGNKVLLNWLLGLSVAVAIPFWAIQHYLDKAEIAHLSADLCNTVLFALPVGFSAWALWRRIDIFSTFIEGAKSGLKTSLQIIPYLVAMLAIVSVLRNSGLLNIVMEGLKWTLNHFDIDKRFIDALPVALMKPISGSGARALMIDTMKTFGPDSFAGRLACVLQGSADTTFYIVALYFGAVGIKNIRYTIAACLLADLAGIITAIAVTYLFFGS